MTPEAAERMEDLTFLADNGVGATEAAVRVGLGSTKSLDKFCRRHRRTDLFSRLKARDYLDLATSNSKTTRHLRRAS